MRHFLAQDSGMRQARLGGQTSRTTARNPKLEVFRTSDIGSRRSFMPYTSPTTACGADRLLQHPAKKEETFRGMLSRSERGTNRSRQITEASRLLLHGQQRLEPKSLPRGGIANKKGRSLGAPGHLQLLEDEPDIVLDGLIAQFKR